MIRHFLESKRRTKSQISYRVKSFLPNKARLKDFRPSLFFMCYFMPPCMDLGGLLILKENKNIEI
ncbi:hypothetical protein STRDD11_01560 [Streptococcus sp. DD11]|nr:hypothetical protein STRDD11_01560 [Streptococcus sp. DD11]